MVLILNGVRQSECPKNSQCLYTNYPVYRETATTLLTTRKREVGPAGLLYVLQREFAATVPQDKNVSIIGSEDATTCIIVVVRHAASGAVALSHFDGSGTEEAVCDMIDKVKKLSNSSEGSIELKLVGGYRDANGLSENLFFRIMNAFHQHPVEIVLTLACVGQLNTEIRGRISWPILYGIGVRVNNGETFPATFPEKGPAECLRSARHLSTNSGTNILDVYDTDSGLLTLPPFEYAPPTGVDFWLRQNDEFLLENMSTSPEVEPPYFVGHIRAAWRYMLDNPEPKRTVFKGGRPLCFRREGESWTPVS